MGIITDPYGIMNIGQYGAGALGLASMLPAAWGGPAAQGLQLGMRINNLDAVDKLRASYGIAPLSTRQYGGGIIGGNDYGNLGGNNTIVNRDQGRNGTAVTTGGIYDNGNFLDRTFARLGGMFGIGSGFSDPHTSMLPREMDAFYPDGRVPTDDQLTANAATQRRLMADPASLLMNPGQVEALQNGFDSSRPALGSAGGNNLMGGSGTQQNPGTLTDSHFQSGSASGFNGGPADIGGTPTSPTQISYGGGGNNGGVSGGSYSGTTAGSYTNATGGISTPYGETTGGNAGYSSGGFSGDAGGSYGGSPSYSGMHAGLAKGGYVPGQPNQLIDDRRINADEGEFMLQRSAAQQLGPDLLNMLNDPQMAAKLRAMLGQRGAQGMPFPGQGQGVAGGFPGQGQGSPFMGQ